MKKYISLFLLLLAVNCFAATRNVVTVCTSGCDYASVKEAIDAEEADLETADEYLDVVITGAFTDTNTIVIDDGYTTTESAYINIYTTEAARHDGTFGSGYILDVPNAANGISITANNYIKIDGLEFSLDSDNYGETSAAVQVANNISGTLWFSNNLVYNPDKNAGSYSSLYGVRNDYSGYPTWYIWNNVIADLKGTNDRSAQGIIARNYGGGDFYIYNNTIANITSGDGTAEGIAIDVGTGYAKNNIVVGCDTGYSGTFSSESKNNLSDDDSTPPYGTYYDDKTIEFADETGGDYHLASTETNAIGKGAFLGNDSDLAFTVDFDTTVRGGTWDIGADQYQTTAYIPITTDFDIPTTSRTWQFNITTWDTYIHSGSITGYLLTEDSGTPELDDEGWVGTEPTTFTVTETNGVHTVYAWLKSDSNELSLQSSDTITLKNLDGQTIEVWANNGMDKVRLDEIRLMDGESVTNPTWDGTTIKLKEAKNAFAQFSVYIEAGEAQLTDMTCEMSTMANGENTLSYNTRSDYFDFTKTDIELFYVRYLELRGVRGGTESESTDGWAEDRWAESVQRPNTPVWHDSTVYPPGFYVDTANDGTLWTDRPGANKFYPDILVPIEEEQPFNVDAAESQQIWVDIWIPKTAATGTYTGNFIVKDNGVTVKTIPVELEVYGFTLPDEHYMKTWGFTDLTNYIARFVGEYYPSTTATTTAAWKNMQFLLHRHGIAFSDENKTDCSIADDSYWMNWHDVLDGSLFSTANGYNGPGIETGQGLFVMGTYGRWRHEWMNAVDVTFTGTGVDDLNRGSAQQYNYTDDVTPTALNIKVEIDGNATPDTFKYSEDNGSTWLYEDEDITGANQDYDNGGVFSFSTTNGHTIGDYWTWTTKSEAVAAGEMQASADTCYTTLESIEPGVKKMLWMLDEPWLESQWVEISMWSDWLHGATGGGENIQAYITGSVSAARSFGGNSVDVAISDAGHLDSWDRPPCASEPNDIVRGYDWHIKNWTEEGKEAQTYWGNWELPDQRTHIAWYLFMEDVEWNLLWQIALWKNNEGGQYYWGEDTELFHQASTLGPHSSSYNEKYGYDTFGNGNGVFMYPGTDVMSRWVTYTGGSGDIDSTYCDDGDGNSARCTYIEDGNMLVTGFSADEFTNGDSVTVGSFTCTLSSDGVSPSYDILGPLASIKMKLYRKTVQDSDYLGMAAAVNRAAVNSIIKDVGIIKRHDKVMDWSSSGCGYGGVANRGRDYYVENIGSISDFEIARERLANIILGIKNGSRVKGGFKGGTIK